MLFRLRSISHLLALATAIAPTATAAAPPAPEGMAQRMQACAGCHGDQGRAASDGYYPRIAGKPQAYLYAQLLHFKARRRSYAPMSHLVKNLSDAYLNDMAAYFSALDLPYPLPQTGSADANMLRRGETLARQGDRGLGLPACAGCHGERLMGVLPATPALLGLPRDYINAQIGAWKTQLRHAFPPDCMAQVAERLTPQDTAAVSAWLAAQPVPPGSHPAPASSAAPTVPELRCDAAPGAVR